MGEQSQAVYRLLCTLPCLVAEILEQDRRGESLWTTDNPKSMIFGIAAA